MISSVFSRIVSGSKHETLLKLKMNPDYAFRFSKNYNYIEIPIGSLVSNADYLNEVVSACTIDPVEHSGFSYLVLPNSKFGPSAVQLLHGGEGKFSPSFKIAGTTNREEVESWKEEDRWAVRIYIIQ